jgi:hypothetical protein
MTAASRRPSLLQALVLIVLTLGLSPILQAADRGEYVIVSGGPALRKWENLRRPGEQHDRWWGNFIRPARMRIQEIQAQDPGAIITWLVYRKAFVTRGAEDKRALTELVTSVRDKFRVRLVWFSSGNDIIAYLNNGQPRGRLPVSDFEFFGHSNKFCFMFDYSNAIYGCSEACLHENDLGKIRNGVFTRDAFCKSWGCHTGESMSKAWRKATGVPMIGAYGKTDYSNPLKVVLSPGGHWTKG